MLRYCRRALRMISDLEVRSLADFFSSASASSGCRYDTSRTSPRLVAGRRVGSGFVEAIDRESTGTAGPH